MRAISCAEPGRLELIEVEAPQLRDGAVRVGIRNIGICGTDYHIFDGHFPYFDYPRIIGHELSGVVLDPNGSTRLKQGDLVVINPYLNCGACPACLEGKANCCETLKVLGVHTDGGMADELVLPEGNLYSAEGLKPRDAAMVEFLAIGAHAVRRTELRRGDRVLVVGAGPIGLGVAFFARIAGADVTLLDTSPDKLRAAGGMGFRALGTSEAGQAELSAIRKSGFEAVFDATGSIAAMNRSIEHVRNGGAYTLVGVIKGDLVFSDPEVHRRELTIRASRNATREDFEHVMASMREGLIPTDQLATHASDLERVREDLPRWAKAREGLIKAIVSV